MEDSWRVSQATATMMTMVVIVTVTGVYGDSQGSFPSMTTQRSHCHPREGQGSVLPAVSPKGKRMRAVECSEPC